MNSKVYVILIFFVLLILSVSGCCDKKAGNATISDNNVPVVNKPVTPPVKERNLRIGRIPFRSARDLVKTHEPLMVYLKNKLNYDNVKMISAPNYEGMAKLLKENKIDIAWLGTKNYIKLKETLDVDAVIRPVRFGKPYYGGLIIARKDSSIKKLEDLKDKVFAFVDKGSASGYLYPLALLLKSGINPTTYFKEIKFLREHDTVVYNVFLKKVDAGCVYDDARLTLKDENQVKELSVIARTPNIPNEPIVVSKSMSPEDKEAIINAFLKLSIDDPETGAVLKQYDTIIKDKISGFIRVTDKDYDVVRDLTKTIEEYEKNSSEGKSEK